MSVGRQKAASHSTDQRMHRKSCQIDDAEMDEMDSENRAPRTMDFASLGAYEQVCLPNTI
jgi:hypothetical protein